MSTHPNRREMLCSSTLAVGAGLTAPVLGSEAAAVAAEPAKPFDFSFNTATIQGQKLPVVKEVEIAATAGYDALSRGFASWICTSRKAAT